MYPPPTTPGYPRCQYGLSVPVGAAIANDAFLRACRGLPVSQVPVWFMRQAGRSLPEYRAIRGDGSMLEAIAHPDLATEITLQPIRRYGVDAAILYSDIVVPAHAIGFGVDIVPGVGPVVDHPFREARDLERLRPLDPEADTPYVLETVRNLVAELDVPLIAFAGAPFTMASYLVEGGPSRTHGLTKRLMHSDPDLWTALLDRLADLAIASIGSQLDAGAAAFQLFDSWAGTHWPPTSIASLCCRRVNGSSPNWQAGATVLPASTLALAPANCSNSWPKPGPTWLGWTGGFTSTTLESG